MARRSFYVFCLFCLFLKDNVQSCKCSCDEPIHCKLTEWTRWDPFVTVCQDQRPTCFRERRILQSPQNGGKECGILNENSTCYNELCPIDCRWVEWSAWSHCTACGSGGRSRYRTVAQPALFNGAGCGSTSVEFDGTCEPEDSCEVEKCDATEFACNNGKCIPSFLKCNGDNDCDDHSDEIDGCTEVNDICSTEHSIPGLSNAGQGYDILSDQLKSGVLDNGKYFGRCEIVHDHSTDQTYRKPWNILDYIDQVQSGQDLEVEGYSSSQDYRRAQKEIAKNSFSVPTLGFEKLARISASVTSSTSTETQDIVQSSTSESSSFFQVEREIQIATFTTRTKDLILTKSFSDDISELPAHFDYQKYTDLFRKYGTHYISSGSLGGKVDHILRYSNKRFRSADTTMSEREDCIGFELSTKIFNTGGEGANSRCNTDSESEYKEGDFIAIASETRTVVSGGSPQTVIVLSQSSVHATKDDYRAWGESILEKPGLLSFTLTPITELLPEEKREHGVAILTAYLDLYNPIHCNATCQNNGEPVVVKEGRECRCICPYPYYGISCGTRDWRE